MFVGVVCIVDDGIGSWCNVYFLYLYFFGIVKYYLRNIGVRYGNVGVDWCWIFYW